ncbi:MAG TPA: di-heme oxidoredictase family protein [Candidatus Saccharimonadales bacterium]|nr:di-heme oxidoredictase family protein [Candidatus Saccharimonadales bacterium]
MDRKTTVRTLLVVLAGAWVGAGILVAAEQPALLGHHVDQQRIADGEMSLYEIRSAGLRLFTTPFNKLDGYGDGPMNPADPTSPGGRPTLQGNGTFLRVNGLDAQSCLECHSQISAATSPPTLGIGGVGGSNSNAIIMPTEMNPSGFPLVNGIADMNGRFANPPFVFGAGGVELLGLEMTEDLQRIRSRALANPGVVYELITKGVSFGSIVADGNGNLDLSNVQGVSDDLVIRPFGRKGEFNSLRAFDTAAVQFHLGMQPVEVVGEGVDDDGDGVTDEITVGDLSALGVFIATADRPAMASLTPSATRGFATFKSIGCADCHRPSLETESTVLPLRYPDVPDHPFDGVYYRIDLTRPPASFERNGSGGLIVPLFADLKRHDMGPGLAESFALADEKTNREFTTARLWGIADSAPYLHDGRATTLTEAILLHGGEAQTVRDAFAALDDAHRDEVLEFLRSLRMPRHPLQQLLRSLRRGGSNGGTALPGREAPSANPQRRSLGPDLGGGSQ